MKVHSGLGSGFLESVYAKAFTYELTSAGLKVECQKPIQVNYKGVIVGDFAADKLVEGRILIEEKATQAITTVHEVQLVNYLTATAMEIGLLLNFGAFRLEYKRKFRTYHDPDAIKEIML